MRRVMTTGCGVVLACLLAGTAIADTPCLDFDALFTPQIVGRWGDGLTVRDVAVVYGDTEAWVLFAGGMLVDLDLASGDQPQLRGAIQVDPEASRVAWTGGVTAVAEPGGRVRMFWGVDPSQITDLGSVVLPAPVEDLCGGYGIVAACGDAGLFRLGRPDGVPAVTDSAVLSGPVVAVAGDGYYAYAATANGRLVRFYASADTLGNMVETSVPGAAVALDCGSERDPDGTGDIRLVAAGLGASGLRLYQDEWYPGLENLAVRADPAPCVDVALLPGLLAAVDGAGKVTVFSRALTVSLGAAGVLTGEPVRLVAAAGDRLLLGTVGRGLAVARVPATAATFDYAATVSGGGTRIAVDGAMAAVVGERLRLLDLAPDVPVEVGSALLPDAGVGVALSGNLVCVAAQNTGLLTYDVSVPGQPYPLGQIVLERYASRVALVGDVALVVATTRLIAVDVSDPTAPTVVATRYMPAVGLDVTRIGSTLYVAVQNAGVQVFDVANPAAPVNLGSFTAATSALKLASTGSVLVTMNGGAVASFDAADPRNPVLVSTVSLPVDLTGARAVGAGSSSVWCAAAFGKIIRFDLGVGGRLEPLVVTPSADVVVNDLTMAGDRVLALSPALTTVLPVACGDLRPPAPALRGLDGGGVYVLTWDRPTEAVGDMCVFRDGDVDPVGETPLICTTTDYYLDGDPGGHTYRIMYRDAWDRWSLPSNEVVRKSQPTPVPEEIAPTLTAAPNPFNPRTMVRFTLPRPGAVRLTVHDLTGRAVAVLADGERAAGDHEVSWNGRDARGRSVASGVYVARLVTAGGAATTRLTLLR